MMTDLKDADDNVQGNVKFFNTTSGYLEEIAGRMLEARARNVGKVCELTCPYAVQTALQPCLVRMSL
jgi:hypothetical protein